MSNLEPIKLHNDRVQIDPKKNEHKVQLSSAREHSGVAMGDDQSKDQNGQRDEKKKKEEKPKQKPTPLKPVSRRRPGQAPTNVPTAPLNSQPPPGTAPMQPTTDNQSATPSLSPVVGFKVEPSNEDVLAEMRRIAKANADAIAQANSHQPVQSNGAAPSASQSAGSAPGAEGSKKPSFEYTKLTGWPVGQTYADLMNEVNRGKDGDPPIDEADMMDHSDSPIDGEQRSTLPSAPIATFGHSANPASSTTGQRETSRKETSKSRTGGAQENSSEQATHLAGRKGSEDDDIDDDDWDRGGNSDDKFSEGDEEEDDDDNDEDQDSERSSEQESVSEGPAYSERYGGSHNDAPAEFSGSERAGLEGIDGTRDDESDTSSRSMTSDDVTERLLFYGQDPYRPGETTLAQRMRRLADVIRGNWDALGSSGTNAPEDDGDGGDQASGSSPPATDGRSPSNYQPTATAQGIGSLNDNANNAPQDSTTFQSVDRQEVPAVSDFTQPENIDSRPPDDFDGLMDKIDENGNYIPSSYPEPGALHGNGQNDGEPSPYLYGTGGDNVDDQGVGPGQFEDNSRNLELLEYANNNQIMIDGEVNWNPNEMLPGEREFYDALNSPALDDDSNEVKMTDTSTLAIDPALQDVRPQAAPDLMHGDMNGFRDEDVTMDDPEGLDDATPFPVHRQPVRDIGEDPHMTRLNSRYGQGDSQLGSLNGMIDRSIVDTHGGLEEMMADRLDSQEDVQPSIEPVAMAERISPESGTRTPREPKPAVYFEPERQTRFPSNPLSDGDNEEARQIRFQNAANDRDIAELEERFDGINSWTRPIVEPIPPQLHSAQQSTAPVMEVAAPAGDPDKRNTDDDDDDGSPKKPSKDAEPLGRLPHDVHQDPEDAQATQDVKQTQPQSKSDIPPIDEVLHGESPPREQPDQFLAQPTGPDEPADAAGQPTKQVSAKVASGGGSGDPEHHSSDDEDDDNRKNKSHGEPHRKPDRKSDKDNDPSGRKQFNEGPRRSDQTPDRSSGSGHGKKKARDYLRQAWELRITQKLTLAVTLLSLLKYIPRRRLEEGREYALEALRLLQQARNVKGIKISRLTQIRCEFYAGYGDIVTGDIHIDGTPKCPEWLITDYDDAPSELTMDYLHNVVFLVRNEWCQESIWAQEWIDHFKRPALVGEAIPDDFDSPIEDEDDDGHENDEDLDGDHPHKDAFVNKKLTKLEQTKGQNGSSTPSESSGTRRRHNVVNALNFQKNSALQNNTEQYDKLKVRTTTSPLATAKERKPQVVNLPPPLSAGFSSGWRHVRGLSRTFFGSSLEKSDIHQMEEGQSPMRDSFRQDDLERRHRDLLA